MPRFKITLSIEGRRIYIIDDPTIQTKDQAEAAAIAFFDDHLSSKVTPRNALDYDSKNYVPVEDDDKDTVNSAVTEQIELEGEDG